MSLGLAGMIQRREDVVTMGAMYKDLGTTFEQSVPEAATDLFNFDRIDQSGDFARMANQVIQVSPTYSLRGGSREVLRGMIARRLGLR
jgi:hypothetical protein